MKELLCTWVPGTVDVVRLHFADRIVELKTTRLTRVFGPHALHDLYLKGRTVLKVSPQQIVLLA